MRTEKDFALSEKVLARTGKPAKAANKSEYPLVNLAACIALAVYPCVASALVISAPGHYIINSSVDEILIPTTTLSAGVTIEVVSGGRVAGDIRCVEQSDDCRATVNVSGSGSVSGFVKGADGSVRLQGDARVGAAGAGSNSGARVYVSDNAHLDVYEAGTVGFNRLTMTGGYVGRNSGTPEFVLVDMSGGTIGSFGNADGLGFNMSGGRVLEGLSGGGFFAINGGEVWGGMNFGSYSWDDSSISGGAFNANLDEYLLRYMGSDALTINGGLFGNINQGSGFYFGGRGAVDIYGRDLVLNDGLLTGYLLDGSYLSVNTTFSSTRSGAFTLHNVPEPGTMSLLALGLAGLGFARRRKAS